MTLAEQFEMSRKKAQENPDDGSVGAIVTHNLARLGWAETTVRVQDIAKAISEKTGKSMSRQRVSLILSKRTITDEALEMIASGIGVSVKELTKPKATKEPK